MQRERFIKSLAEYGYNVYFGAKKHFATYDIVEKSPGWIGLITLIIGIWQLGFPSFPYGQSLSVILVAASVCAIQISQYNAEKDYYMRAGTKLTRIHNELKEMYYRYKDNADSTVSSEDEEKLTQLLNDYYEASITKQIAFSDWYAHYKFFYQAQYEWIDEQKRFTWKDKFPLSFRITVLVIIIVIVIVIILAKMLIWN
ncbi:SLATT domain-containing protein [Bacillus stratosphericus]|uniref:SLATT domain-containing protein n=1 Tax=Bacillus stratosphericus TaxID=293386 RepID=UPI001CFB6986|nr:SLATT domain-containing protein [Bacillus stratosphericus]